MSSIDFFYNGKIMRSFRDKVASVAHRIDNIVFNKTLLSR